MLVEKTAKRLGITAKELIRQFEVDVFGPTEPPRLKGWEKRRMRKKIEGWIEECNLDMYVDKDQMWRDLIMIRGHSADCLPLAMIHMITGWELFIAAEDAMTPDEISAFRAIFNPEAKKDV